MSIVFADREAAYPHKYKIIPENGGDAYYVVLERADEPLTPGTPLNAETFNKLIDDYESLVATHANSKDNPHGVTREQVGAAPAGFGYGDRMTYVDMTTDTYKNMTFANALDSVMETMREYSVAQIQIYDPTFPHTSNKCFCTLWKYTSNYATLECISYSGYKAIMRKTSGAWGGWELDNPPLTEFSTVYPTTERYRGKVVYVVQYDVGALANNGTTTVEHNLKIAHHELVRCVGFAQHSNEYRYYSLPMINSSGQVVATIQLSATAINIHTFSDLSAYKGIVTLYFTGD